MTVPQWLILVGAGGMCINTVGWVLIFMGVLPEYPYLPIGLGCIVVYFAGRILRRREVNAARSEDAFDPEGSFDGAGGSEEEHGSEREGPTP